MLWFSLYFLVMVRAKISSNLYVLPLKCSHTLALFFQKQTVEDFALRDVVVDYCAFGRPEQKSTRLWSNSPLLLEHLRDFRCETSCTQMKNHKAVKGRTEESNSKIIPQPLAETVARFVDSDLFLKGIQKTKAAFPGQILNSTYV